MAQEEPQAMTEVEYETARETVAIGDTLRVCYKSVYSSSDTRTEMTVTVEEASAGDSEDTLTVETETGERYQLVIGDTEARVLTERSNGWMRVSEEGSVEVQTEAAEEAAETEESEEDTEDTEESEAAESDGESEEEPEESGPDHRSVKYEGPGEERGQRIYWVGTKQAVVQSYADAEGAQIIEGPGDLTEAEIQEIDRHLDEPLDGLALWLKEDAEDPLAGEESEETTEDTAETAAAESAAEEREEETETEAVEDTEEDSGPDLDRLLDTAEQLSDLGLLSEGQAKVYLAREVEGMGRSEAAEALDMAPSTTDTHRQRAKPKVEDLREALDLLNGYESVANGGEGQ